MPNSRVLLVAIASLLVLAVVADEARTPVLSLSEALFCLNLYIHIKIVNTTVYTSFNGQCACCQGVIEEGGFLNRPKLCQQHPKH